MPSWHGTVPVAPTIRARPGTVSGEGRTARPAGRGGADPQGRADRSRELGDYEFPAIPRQWADASGSAEMREWLNKFADDRAAGRHDPSAGIAG